MKTLASVVRSTATGNDLARFEELWTQLEKVGGKFLEKRKLFEKKDFEKFYVAFELLRLSVESWAHLEAIHGEYVRCQRLLYYTYVGHPVQFQNYTSFCGSSVWNSKKVKLIAEGDREREKSGHGEYDSWYLHLLLLSFRFEEFARLAIPKHLNGDICFPVASPTRNAETDPGDSTELIRLIDVLLQIGEYDLARKYMGFLENYKNMRRPPRNNKRALHYEQYQLILEYYQAAIALQEAKSAKERRQHGVRTILAAIENYLLGRKDRSVEFQTGDTSPIRIIEAFILADFDSEVAADLGRATVGSLFMRDRILGFKRCVDNGWWHTPWQELDVLPPERAQEIYETTIRPRIYKKTKK